MGFCWWIPEIILVSFAAWVTDCPEIVMVAQYSSLSSRMCAIFMVRWWEVQHFNHSISSRGQHGYFELLEATHITVLHTLGVHPICNQLWQYPLCNVYQLWQRDEWHQLLLGLVNDLRQCLLINRKARNVKDQFDNWFTSIPCYPGFQFFSVQCDSLESNRR